jgi:exonuclease SbcC
VRLNSLQLTNFRQHADTRIEFDVGLTGIIGPNGAGKSTVLEAIAWALYGQSAVRGTRDSIRNVRAGPRAPVRVELDFELGGHRYRVVRGLSNAELYQDGGSEPIASTITEVAEKLARRLGMSRAEFFHTYFTGQKELAVMAAMSPTERAQFLSRVLGYDRIRAAQGLARERRKLLAAEISGVKELMPDAQRVEDALREASARRKEADRRLKAAGKLHRQAAATLAALAPQWEAAQRKREAVQQLLADLRLAGQEVESLGREDERLTKELAEIDVARAELETIASQLAPLNELHDEWRMVDALSREEGRRRTLADTLKTLSEELTVIRERQAALRSLSGLAESIGAQIRDRTKELDVSTAALEARRTDWVRDKQEAITKRESLRSQYQEVRDHFDKIVELGEEGVCPTCQRMLGDHFRDVHENLEEQLETITVNGKYYKTRLDQLDAMEVEFRQADEQRKVMRQEINELERQLAKAQSAAQELSALGRDLSAKEHRHAQLTAELATIPSGFDERRYAELEREMDRIGPLNEQLTRLSARIDREEADRAAYASVHERFIQARQKATELQARYQDANFSEEELQRQRAGYEGAVATLRQAELELQASTAEETRAAEAAATAERDRQELERARDHHARLESDRRLHEELDRAYTDLRTELNTQLRPELSDVAASFLSELTGMRYSELEIDANYDVVLYEDGIPKPVISGGEEDIANLALRLAISQMIAERSGQSFSMLILDEVFGSLDIQRQRDVIDVLRRLGDRFEQVILISHVDVSQYDVDHGFEMTYDPNAGKTVVRPLWSAANDQGMLDVDAGELEAGIAS